MTNNVIDLVREAIHSEVTGIQHLSDSIDHNVAKLMDHMLKCQGKVILTGIGKSGIVARKIAATLSSTGTPSLFLHGGESSHGDLGVVTKEDIVIMLSNSGETEELILTLPSLDIIGCFLVVVTANNESTLASKSSLCITIPKLQEADSYNLAPTVSSTAMLVLGDAIAITLMKIKGVSDRDFSLYHPSGSLGKKLTLRVTDIMKNADDIPKIRSGEKLITAIFEISSKGMGATLVVDDNNNCRLLGIITDGDIRRLVESGQAEFWDLPAGKVISKKAHTVKENCLAYEALQIMKHYKIMVLPVVDSNDKIVGIVHMHQIIERNLR